ncbi:hypothetical protein, partial [Pontiella sp.]|uniref:hypothetical protein n=1 Tax=Pontiella sp. TaxID=2837462 RepID=UPI0035681314
GYLPENNPTDAPDGYDEQSAHILTRTVGTGHLAGYCRMIFDQPRPLPITCLYPHLAAALDTPVEISRFSVRHLWRGRFHSAGLAPIFQLSQGLLLLTRQYDLKAWSCLIDHRFQQLCERFFKVDFEILGEPALYMGSPCVPCVVKLSESIRNNIRNPRFEDVWSEHGLDDWARDFDVK